MLLILNKGLLVLCFASIKAHHYPKPPLRHKYNSAKHHKNIFTSLKNHQVMQKQEGEKGGKKKEDKPEAPGSCWKLEAPWGIFDLTAEPKPPPGSVWFPRGDAAKMMSRSAGSLKQVLPVSLNFLHLARVFFIKAWATCFETLGTPNFEARLPRVACQC